MSGVLKKDRGLIVNSEKLDDRGRVYCLASPACVFHGMMGAHSS